MARAGPSLLIAFLDGKNASAREDRLFASLLGGLALANEGLGAVHGFASPIGGMFDTPHGAICACLLAPGTKMNIKAIKHREPHHPAMLHYQEIARILVRESRATLEDLI